MIRTGLATAACMIAVDTGATSLEGKLLEYGVIGVILIFFIWKDRDRQQKSEAQWTETNKQLFGYLERNTAAHVETGQAVRTLTDELRHRPCLKQRED